jgi:hypothetical protein
VLRNLSRALDSPSYSTTASSRPNLSWTETTNINTTHANANKNSQLDAPPKQKMSLPSSHQSSNSMNTVMTAALKEWAIVCKALEDGRQVLLLRKGGIIEYRQGFDVKHYNFLLYPTFEHQSKESIQVDYADKLDIVLKEQPRSDKKNQITSYARTVLVKHVSDSSLLQGLQKYHIWSDRYVSVRMNYNPKKPMSIILLRVYMLDNPIEVDVKTEWLGCKSWISIESHLSKLKSLIPLEQQGQRYIEGQSNHTNYNNKDSKNGNTCQNNTHQNERPCLEDSKFDKIVSEIEEILE